MKCRRRDYEVAFTYRNEQMKVNVEAEDHMKAVLSIMRETQSEAHIQSVLLAKDTNPPKWVKWAFWVGVANLIGQIALVIENLINLKGNGFV